MAAAGAPAPVRRGHADRRARQATGGQARRSARVTTVVPKPVAPEQLAPVPIATRPWPVRQPVKGSAIARLLRTTDAKQIGLMYLVTSFAFFFIGGFLALIMRAELARPGLQFLSTEQYNQ